MTTRTGATRPVDAHVPNLAGLPPASEWITHFAAQLPVQHKPHHPRAVLAAAGMRARTWLRDRALRNGTAAAGSHRLEWVAMLSASMVDAHQRRVRATEPDTHVIDREIAWCVRTLDAKIAVLFDVPAGQVDVGRLVSAIAQQWVTYAQHPQDATAITSALAAQRAYSARVEQLSALSRRGTS
ncbi:hypothetical protein [Nocardia sputi]|uniref:hypothetical protein n=1 Tax=Nocardia sputi TaxID=2943705 RepID=UPI0020BFF1A7|nr:hypothetical protein [Nocardia sputi]